MKKFLIITNVLTLCVLYFQGCTPSGQWFKHNVNGSFIVPSEKGYGSCYNCAIDDLHFQTPLQFSDAVMRYHNTTQYFAERYRQAPITNRLGSTATTNTSFQDTRSCWFSADTLKKFICLMEKYSAQKGIGIDRLGVRFYYGNYSDAKGVNAPHNPAYAYMHTLFLVPTVDSTESGGITHYDFDPKYTALTPGYRIITLGKLIDSLPKSQAFLMRGGAQNFNMNEGDLCPPGNGCLSTLNRANSLSGGSH